MKPRRIYRLQRYGNLLTLRANASSNSIEPILIRLLVDTGSSYTTVPRAVIDDLGCTAQPPLCRIAIVAAGGVIQAPIFSLPKFNCLGKQVENFPVIALDLPFNPLVTGLLGMDFLDLCDAVINVKSAEIHIANCSD